MNTPVPPDSTHTPSKLIVRSEVLAVIRHLVGMGDPPKQERLKQLKRLQDLNAADQVQDVLVKELQRSASSDTLDIITEFLMEFGEIDYLQDKLWAVIRSPDTSDEIKDAANLVLRHLGDASDPNLYLEYLDDPQGLIGRETIRMLEVSAENPEALIDFIDFILSLPAEDQCRMLDSLQRDYPSEYLVNLYVPLLESDPSPEMWEQLIINLGESRSPKAAESLARLVKWPADRLPVPHRLIQKALKQLQLAGVYSPAQPDETGLGTAASENGRQHPLVKQATPYQCFVTISDGIGNQGLIFSRQHTNGDIAMISVALNDVHGVIDCFGFYELSLADFIKIREKFHEETTKISVSPEFCAYKLHYSESLNRQNAYRLPYEYGCWRGIISDLPMTSPEDQTAFRQWVRTDWYPETNNLYQHPDFNSWFMEQGDDPVATGYLQQVVMLTEEWLFEHDNSAGRIKAYYNDLTLLADRLMESLLETPWRELIRARLAEAAYLLDCQQTHTFRNLAATEAHKLETQTDSKILLDGFVRHYGRRCVSEELLRLKTGNAHYDRMAPVVDALLDRWGV